MQRIGRVIDTDELGRIKVEIIPELQDFPENLLPWAVPIQNYSSQTDFKLDRPAKNSLVIIEVNDTWTEFSYDGRRPYSEYDNRSTDALALVRKYGGDNFKPKYLNYSSSPKMAIFKDDSGKTGIVFGENIWVTYDGSKFTVKNGDKSIEVSNTEVKINGDHLVVT